MATAGIQRSANDEFPFAQASPWRCPRCHAGVDAGGSGLICRSGRHRYPVIDGIPDFRVAGALWIDVAQDNARASELANMDVPLGELVRAMYTRPGWSEDRITLRSSQVLAAPARLQDDITGWLSSVTSGGTFLDLGCGPGMLLAAAADKTRQGIGIDASMTCLVVAKRLITEHGGTPVLAAALGEALPLADGLLDGVVSLDVIEHVHDVPAYLREIDRVTRVGGQVSLSTPNRWSLTPEPHVFVWGVGLLPRRFQARYVRWRSGKDYDAALMSSFELRRIIAHATKFAARIVIPAVPEIELKRFGPAKAWLARTYNRTRSWQILRWPLLVVGPFFQITGVRRRSHIAELGIALNACSLTLHALY